MIAAFVRRIRARRRRRHIERLLLELNRTGWVRPYYSVWQALGDVEEHIYGDRIAYPPDERN